MRSNVTHQGNGVVVQRRPSYVASTGDGRHIDFTTATATATATGATPAGPTATGATPAGNSHVAPRQENWQDVCTPLPLVVRCDNHWVKREWGGLMQSPDAEVQQVLGCCPARREAGMPNNIKPKHSFGNSGTPYQEPALGTFHAQLLKTLALGLPLAMHPTTCGRLACFFGARSSEEVPRSNRHDEAVMCVIPGRLFCATLKRDKVQRMERDGIHIDCSLCKESVNLVGGIQTGCGRMFCQDPLRVRPDWVV